MGTNSITNETNFDIDDDNLSYYYGFKNSKSDEELNKIEQIIATKDFLEDKEENIIDEKNILIPVAFEWDQGGNNVYLSGSFCNWKQFFLMKKEKDGKFTLNLTLPRGIFQYKFKVDEEWKYNDKFPTCQENFITNNYIDTTNMEIVQKNIEERTTTGNSSNLTENNEITKLSKKSLIKCKNFSCLSHKIYSNYKPSKEELKENIPELPFLYKSCININLHSNQNNIGNAKFIKVREKNILSDNISFKNIENIHHEQINHLNVNINQFINDSDKMIFSVSSRYRQKFTTFVYYKPNKNINNNESI